VQLPNLPKVMKAFFTNMTLVLLGLFFAVSVLELAVRVLPLPMLPVPLRQLVHELEVRSQKLSNPDPQLRHVIRPRTDYLFTWRDFSFRLKTNLNFSNAGFRGGTLGGPAWAVAVGDSFTFGHGVNQEATWVARLAGITTREIVNLGVPRWGPQQYTRSLEKYGIPLKPKVIFWCLFANDLSDSIIFERWLRGRSDRFSLGRFLRTHTVTFAIFRRLRVYLRAGSEDVNLREVSLRFNSKIVRANLNAESKRFSAAWPLATREIETAYRESQAAKATFVLLYFPSKEQVYWDSIKEQAKSLESFDASTDNLSRATLEFCQSRHLLCLDLTPALRKRALRREKLYFTIDGHWNEHGHDAVAREIYSFLLAQKIL
jgi:hypothetical protein